MAFKIPKNFLNLSHLIGDDSNLVQGAGGNTSYKENGEMWVKASGKWLSEACLLYTSDAADDSLRVDLGGRRIIKKPTPSCYTGAST